MWEARTQVVPLGLRFQLFQNDAPLPFRGLFSLLEANSDFSRWYTQTLATCEFTAFFWENPPLTTDTIDNAAEFVLIESASLAGLRADPEPFRPHFASHPNSTTLTFPNLARDALLVVPSPITATEAYGHLATFVRTAPEVQVRSVWAAAARVVRENLGPTPRWLSTSGLGVSWLHLRLDTRPKYYQFTPYTAAA
jgi:hypothetical protein